MNATARLRALLPAEILCAVGDFPPDMTELRLRAGQPAQVESLAGGELRGDPLTAEQVRAAALALSGHSLYAREEELREGYFTIEGGCRIGVCGRMAMQPDGRPQLTHIGSVSVRIARAVAGAADGVMPMLYEAGQPVSALILSPPGWGKTTLLRDIARQLSDGTAHGPGVPVALADERGELAGCCLGVPTLAVGARTDVMDGCPKRYAIPLLIRAMAPQVIVTDELGHAGDVEAVRDALRCGVRVIASAHAADEGEALARLGAPLMDAFRRVIVLGGIGRVLRVAQQ